MIHFKSRVEDSKLLAANCAKLAQESATSSEREHWLDVEQFWLRRAEAAEAEATAPASPIVVE